MTRAEQTIAAEALFSGNLPANGIEKEQLLASMAAVSQDDVNFKQGKVWSLVYHKDEAHYDTIQQAHNMFFSANYLNPMAFKSVKKFETDVVRMVVNMMQGDDNTVGTMTSGGTESILMAIKTYRDRARKKKPWLRRPNMIAPITAHVAFEKAAKYFDVDIIYAPTTSDYRADVKAMAKLINRRTILLVGSAPAYPQGVIDPIADLGQLALKKKLPLHVDACLGGFVLPFLREMKYPIASFDFTVPGVTSISADVHKYGYAAKGASVIMYKNMSYLRHQFLAVTGWPGGVYASPALLGTRAGSAIAAAWASMQSIGKQGFMDMCKTTMELAQKMQDGINDIEGLQVLGKPDMTVFSYHSTDSEINIFAVGDQMEARGWSVNRQQKPDALHAMVTINHAQAIDQYLADLTAAVAAVRSQPELAYEGSAAMYGMISKVPLRGMIENNVIAMLAQSYTPGNDELELSTDDEQGLAMTIGNEFVKLSDKLRHFIKG